MCVYIYNTYKLRMFFLSGEINARNIPAVVHQMFNGVVSSSAITTLPLSLPQVRATRAQLLLQVKGLDKFGVNVSFLTDMIP